MISSLIKKLNIFDSIIGGFRKNNIYSLNDIKTKLKKLNPFRIRIIAMIRKIHKNIQEEKSVIIERDPAIRESKEVWLYPSFRAMIYYRLSHKLYLKNYYFLARLISQIAAHRTGIEIHPGATIGKHVFIDHGLGVIIGETSVIGNNVTIYQGVTLGGTGKHKGKRHPNIGDDVMIGAGARVLGPLTIGKGTKIGAGSVVLQDVPEYCTVVGVPGRIVRNNNNENPMDSLDQINLPDPVLQDIELLRNDVEYIKNIINQK